MYNSTDSLRLSLTASLFFSLLFLSLFSLFLLTLALSSLSLLHFSLLSLHSPLYRRSLSLAPERKAEERQRCSSTSACKKREGFSFTLLFSCLPFPFLSFAVNTIGMGLQKGVIGSLTRIEDGGVTFFQVINHLKVNHLHIDYQPCRFLTTERSFCAELLMACCRPPQTL